MKIFKFLLVSLIFLGVAKIAAAQDVIVKKDSSTILSKVVEISSTEIKYKKWSNQDGPTYLININEVMSINYANGEIDKFESQPEETPVVTEEPETQAEPEPQPEPQQQPQQETVVVNNQTTTVQPVKQKYQRRFSRERVQFSLSLGAAMPLGYFGEYSDLDFSTPLDVFNNTGVGHGYGAAKMGYNANMQLHIPVFNSKKGSILGILVKFNLQHNALCDDEKDDFQEYLDNMSWAMNYAYDVNAYKYKVTKFPTYTNTAFMVGIDFTHFFAKPFGLFAEADFGINIGSISNLEINNEYGNTFVYYYDYVNYYSDKTTTAEYDSYFTTVYEVGAGLFLVNHISLGVYYTRYSPFQVTGTLSVDGAYGHDESMIYSGEIQNSTLSFRMGIHF